MRTVILISGRGSNMQAIVERQQAGELAIDIRAIISNRPDATGLEFAQQHGIHTEVVDHRPFSQRNEFDQRLQQAIDQHQPQLVILAGFMRILGPAFVAHYRGRMLNIHPSLLPKYTGLDTHSRAIAAGDTEHGASIHFVTEELDGGPLISQVSLPIQDHETAEPLSQRVLKEEHRLYPLAIHWFASGRLSLHTDANGQHQAQLDGLALQPPLRMNHDQLQARVRQI